MVTDYIEQRFGRAGRSADHGTVLHLDDVAPVQ
jgi:hypothetical protein